MSTKTMISILFIFSLLAVATGIVYSVITGSPNAAIGAVIFGGTVIGLCVVMNDLLL